jgi:flagellar hook-associated protein 1 FlgK
MPGTFHGINLSSQALRAFQRGMDVTGHNLANVNTRGYSRQTVEYRTNDPLTFWSNGSFSLGQGATISSINRIRDQFLDGRMQSVQGDMGRFETLSQALGQIEPVFNEPGPNGISTALDRFFNAWSGLASNPGQAANRIEVQQAGATLASRIRNTWTALNQRSTQLSAEMTQVVRDVNDLSQRIADLNHTIREELASGGAPNDLMDQRDIAIEQLANLVNVNTFAAPNGEITVHFGGYPLVDVAGAHQFPATLNASGYTVSDGSRTYPVGGGKLYGLMEAQNKVSSYMSSLDTLANSLREQINTIHATGINQNATTGINFFNQNAVPPQNGAIDFDLSAEVKADVKNIAAGTSGTTGDGGLALSLSGLRNLNVVGLGNQTFSGFYSSFIGQVGRDAEYANVTVETQAAITSQIESQRQSISGVSIDEEMTNLLRLQRSYQAAARALSVFDQMTEELIGLVR